MKKPLIFLLTLFYGLTFANSNFDYELIRTKEAPGFFMVKLFAPINSKPILKKEIYIKNFAENEEKKYRELFPFIQQKRHGRIISADEFRPKKVNPQKHVVIVLGKPLNNYLNFKLSDGNNVFQEFQNFAGKYLSPVVLDNLQTEFGGNVFAVKTKQNKITTTSPAIFVGKFRKPLPTRMRITGNTLNSRFELETPLELDNPAYTEDKIAQFLPEIWNELAHPQDLKNPAKKSNFFKKINWGRIFFYLILLLVVVLVIALIRYIFREKEAEDWEIPSAEEVPIFHSQNSKNKELENIEKIDSAKTTEQTNDLPFEVVWKSEINQ